MTRRWRVFLIVATLAIVFDQATKIWARHALDPGVPVPVIRGYWDWHLSMNDGSAFSLIRGAIGVRVFLSIIGVIALGAIGWMVQRAKDDQRGLIWALALIAGGAIGNLIDRIGLGVVTDFARWHWQDKASWPVFNVADIALVVGVGLLLIDALRGGRARVAHA